MMGLVEIMSASVAVLSILLAVCVWILITRTLHRIKRLEAKVKGLVAQVNRLERWVRDPMIKEMDIALENVMGDMIKSEVLSPVMDLDKCRDKDGKIQVAFLGPHDPLPTGPGGEALSCVVDTDKDNLPPDTMGDAMRGMADRRAGLTEEEDG